MEFEFDKEMDAILRKARGNVGAVTSVGAHMDADELAAFADNAVSAPARMRYVAHLADCTRCRKILSNIVLSNPEAVNQAASSAVAAPAREARAPWYRRFLVFPQLAYTMGGAVLVFSAFFGYLIIKNLPGASNSDVSFSTNKAPAAEPQRAPSNASAPVSTANSNTTATTTNSSVPSIPSAATNSNSTASSAPILTGNTNAVATKPAQQPEKPADNEVISVAPQATPAITTDSRSEDKTATLKSENDQLARTSPASPNAGAVSQNRAKEEDRKKDADEAQVRDDAENFGKVQAKRKQASPKTLEKAPANPGATRSVGGKTFNNVGGIWFDEAAGGKKQKTVRRGTRDYEKLDAGLRSIADQFNGTVVISWGGKAYRIE